VVPIVASDRAPRYVVYGQGRSRPFEEHGTWYSCHLTINDRSVSSANRSLLFTLHRTVVFLPTSICPIAVCVVGLAGLVLATLDKSVPLQCILT
jgi:hypothetical protein